MSKEHSCLTSAPGSHSDEVRDRDQARFLVCCSLIPTLDPSPPFSEAVLCVLSSSASLPVMSYSNRVKPVALPSGRERLCTNPLAR
jgi:hypothetical protein